MSKFLLLAFVCTLTALHNAKGLTALTGDINDANGGTNYAYRLPDSTEPVSYDLWITPDIENRSFHGQVDIVVKAKQYTTEVILNSKDLILTSAPWFQDIKTNRSIAIKDYAFDDRREQLVVKLERSIFPSRIYKFSVAFRGILRDDYTGFHKYFYDSGNHSRYLRVIRNKRDGTNHIITLRPYIMIICDPKHLNVDIFFYLFLLRPSVCKYFAHSQHNHLVENQYN